MKLSTKIITTLLLTLLFISCGSSGNSGKYSISGTIKDDNTNAPLSNVILSIENGSSISTNSEGKYKFENIQTDTTVIITIEKSGYYSGTKTIIIIKNETLDVSLTKKKKYSISGVIKDANTQDLLENVTIATSSTSPKTNYKGEYELQDIEEGKTIQLTASKDGYVPFTQSITVQKDEKLNFLLTPKGNIGNIQGVILDNTGEVIQGASISIANKNTFSNEVGFYRISSVTSGTQQITVSKVNHEALTTSVNIGLNNLTTKNITLVKKGEIQTQTGILEGNIKDKATSQSLSGVIISINNKTATSNTNGSYYISGISYGQYNLTTSLSGYETHSQTITINKESDILDVEIKKSTSTLKGKVTSNNQAISGVSITIGDKTALTDNEGNYIIENITTFSTRRINASKDGYNSYQGEASFVKGYITMHNIGMIVSSTIYPTTDPTSNTNVVVANANTAPATSSSLLKKTGQTASYGDYDDGYYKRGIKNNYTRSNDIVTDTITKLQWQDDNAVKFSRKSYSNAIRYCRNLTFASYNDWKLPTIKELRSLINIGKTEPPTSDLFQNIPYAYYWSSSRYAGNESFAWIVYFTIGTSGYTHQSNDGAFVRCVRSIE